MRTKSLASPYLVWMVIFTVVPLGIVVWFALTDYTTGAFTLANLARVGTYTPIFLKSVWLALVSSLICLVVGYPVAYYIAGTSPRTQRFLYMLVMLPMCMSFLLRTLAWVALLEDTGIINNLIRSIGLQPLPLIRNDAAVVLGMVYNYLPYMIMPLYTVLIKLDDKLIEAAEEGHAAVERAGDHLGAHDGVRPGGVHLLYLPENGLLGHHAHRRRDREPVQGGL